MTRLSSAEYYRESIPNTTNSVSRRITQWFLSVVAIDFQSSSYAQPVSVPLRDAQETLPEGGVRDALSRTPRSYFLCSLVSSRVVFVPQLESILATVFSELHGPAVLTVTAKVSTTHTDHQHNVTIESSLRFGFCTVLRAVPNNWTSVAIASTQLR